MLLSLSAAVSVAAQCVPVEQVVLPPPTVVAANSTYYTNGAPPERYRGDTKVVFQFDSRDEVHAICAAVALPVPCGSRYGACVIGNVVHVPNPCSEVSEYAATLCHELAHVNGWPASHGD